MTRAWTQIGPTPDQGSHTQAGSMLGTPAFAPPEQVAGDLDIIPARTASSWELKQEGTALIMCVPDELLSAVAAQLDRNPSDIEIADRFQMRDPVIEHIGWTLKADIDSNLTGGRLLRDSLGVALAARLLQRHYRGSLPMREIRGGLTHTKLERVIAHIEDNLASKLSLPGIAEIAGMSVSHLKTLFRNSTGVPVYEYVLRRRVERAQFLLRNHKFSIAEVALSCAANSKYVPARLARSTDCRSGSSIATTSSSDFSVSAIAAP